MDSTLTLDNFALEQFETCPRKYFLRVVKGYVPRTTNAAIAFGVQFHEGLAAWYRSGSPKEALQAIAEKWTHDVPPDDHRTLNRCLETFAAYVREYPREAFRVVGAPSAPLVEVGFTLDTGLGFSYGGIMDAVIARGDEVFVMDHKTTSQLGEQYFQQYKPNNQISGYVWGATCLTGKTVNGALINAIGVLKSENKFRRGFITRSPQDINDWLCDVAEVVEDIRRAFTMGFWRKRTTGCVTRYGRCMYHDVCALADGKTRERYLDQEFEKKPWSHESRDAEG
jgi:hypothetical protein